VDDNQKRCLSHGANVRKDLEVALDNYCSATTSHPAARAAAGGTAREQKLLQLHGDQAFLNAALQTGLLQLKKAQKEPAEEAPVSAEVELAELKAALLAAEARQRDMETTATKFRDDLRQSKAAGKRRLSPPMPFTFKSLVRPAEGWHHERLSATGDLDHLSSMPQHHSAMQTRTGIVLQVR
jgi:hypothetical protein